MADDELASAIHCETPSLFEARTSGNTCVFCRNKVKMKCVALLETLGHLQGLWQAYLWPIRIGRIVPLNMLLWTKR